MAFIKSLFVALSTVRELLKLFKLAWSKYSAWKLSRKLKKINKAIDKGDTSAVEKLIGSDNAGKPAKRRHGVSRREGPPRRSVEAGQSKPGDKSEGDN